MVASVKLVQYGGHLGSFAGDSALVVIEDDRRERHAVIIDTGDSTAWAAGAPNARSRESNTRTPKSLADAVADEVGGRVPVTLVTTHFHKDHFNPKMLGGVRVERHIFPDVPGADAIASPSVLRPGHHRVDIGGLEFSFYVPPPGNPADANDNCMAVYFSHNQLSYVGFGDMTPDAFLRCRGDVPPHPITENARWVKYPHHGSPANYLDYFTTSIEDTEGVNVLISGNTGAVVTDAIRGLLRYWENVSDVYCLARTCEAKDAFNLNMQHMLAYVDADARAKLRLCTDIRLDSSGVVEMIGEVEWEANRRQQASAAQANSRAARANRRGDAMDET